MKSLIISLFVLALGVTVALGATTDFVADADITLDSVSGNALTIKSGSRAESWTYNGGTLTVTNPDATNRFKVMSSNAASLKASDSAGTQVSCVDNASPGTTYLTVPSTADTYTISTSGSACSVSSSVSSGSGGGGGGGGGTPAIPAIPATPAVPTVSPAVPATPALPALANASPRAAFLRRLVVGSVGSDVKNLQQFLNERGFTVSASGAGSVGRETTTFGPATKRALIKFQLAKGIIGSVTASGAGTLGPRTRAFINASRGEVRGAFTDSGDESAKQAQIQSLTAQIQALTNLINQLKTQGAR